MKRKKSGGVATKLSKTQQITESQDDPIQVLLRLFPQKTEAQLHTALKTNDNDSLKAIVSLTQTDQPSQTSTCTTASTIVVVKPSEFDSVSSSVESPKSPQTQHLPTPTNPASMAPNCLFRPGGFLSQGQMVPSFPQITPLGPSTIFRSAFSPFPAMSSTISSTYGFTPVSFAGGFPLPQQQHHYKNFNNPGGKAEAQGFVSSNLFGHPIPLSIKTEPLHMAK